MKNPYFTFVIKKKDLEIDLTAREILDRIAIACNANLPLSVTKIMSIQGIASPATIHRKIDDLLREGLIYHMQKDANRRTKYVVLTAKGEKYFKDLGELMAHAVAVAK